MGSSTPECGLPLARPQAGTSPAAEAEEWQPFTKLVWLVFLFGIPIAIGGAWRVGAFVILGVIVFSVLCVLVWALGRSQPQRGEVKDPVAA